jgi:hypothetical protein
MLRAFTTRAKHMLRKGSKTSAWIPSSAVDAPCRNEPEHLVSVQRSHTGLQWAETEITWFPETSRNTKHN